MTSPEKLNIFQFKDCKPNPDVFLNYGADVKRDRIPLIIDNGSYHCRVGWANETKPILIFKNIVARVRKERGKKVVQELTNDVQVGNEIQNIEAVRFQLKSAFDRNIVTQFEVMEQTLDYVFQRLSIEPQGKVNHPVLITEPYLNLNYSRQLMSELMFESYDVPGICYCVDSLLSYNASHAGKDGVIINLGHHTTHIIPVLSGKVAPHHSRRINIGGFHIVGYLHRLLQLKYPSHANAITLSRAEEIVQDHSFIAENYEEELKKWFNKDHYDKEVRIIQLPFVAPVAPTVISLEQQREKKKELQRRLLEINARKREEKLTQEEELLNKLLDAQELFETRRHKLFKKSLATLGLLDSVALTKAIATSKEKIDKIKQRIQEAAASAAASADEKPNDAPQNMDKISDETSVTTLRAQRNELLARRTARRQRKRDLAQRRTAAAQERMRIISQLARKDKKDDNFGMRDEDWDVYKVINRDGGSSDSELEAEKLATVEAELRIKDPGFESGSGSSDAPGESHQLHVGIERMRAPEVIFQPSLVGCPEAGLAETLEYVLNKFSLEQRFNLVSNVFLTGGCASLPGLKARITRELIEMLPFLSLFQISTAPGDPGLSAWHGAQRFAMSPQFREALITKKDYEENGGEYLKEHLLSNPFYATPVTTQNIVESSTADQPKI